jgi:hypothetical protein
MRWLFNDKHSIRTQLGVAFLLISAASVGVCLAISLGFTTALGTSTYTSAGHGVQNQAKDHATTDALELATAIAKSLAVIAESACMVSSLQAMNFIQRVYETKPNSFVFPYKKFDSFREYRFVPGCVYPSCPADFGDLSQTSPLSHWNGSLVHSSVYMYKSRATHGGYSGAQRNDSSWDHVLQTHPVVQPLVDALAYQDHVFHDLYDPRTGYNTTVFFYLSVQVCDSSCSDGYISLHRGYPGTVRNSSSYDPPSRGWFVHAPEDAYYMEGPYKETFTSLYVVNLSSRKTIVSRTGTNAIGQVVPSLPLPTTIVTSAVITLDALTNLIRNNVYPNSGFGVLIKRSTLEVLVWRNQTTGEIFLTFCALHAYSLFNCGIFVIAFAVF